MFLGHGINLSRQRTTTAPLPKTITYSLYSFIWRSDNFLDVSIIKHIQVVPFEKQCQSLDSNNLFLRVPIETTEVYTWKPKRNQSPKRRIWKIKARLAILNSKTPTWPTLGLSQAVFRCSSVLYVLSPLWLRSHPTPLSRDGALLNIYEYWVFPNLQGFLPSH
jgi:hypothetical protein